MATPESSSQDLYVADDPYTKDVVLQKLLQTAVNSVGQSIVYPNQGEAEISVLLAELPPGKETGWHEHPVLLVGYILSGEVTVYFKNGETQIYRAGQAVAEAVDLVHNGVNEGTEVARMLVFVLGKKGEKYAVKRE